MLKRFLIDAFWRESLFQGGAGVAPILLRALRAHTHADWRGLAGLLCARLPVAPNVSFPHGDRLALHRRVLEECSLRPLFPGQEVFRSLPLFTSIKRAAGLEEFLPEGTLLFPGISGRFQGLCMHCLRAHIIIRRCFPSRNRSATGGGCILFLAAFNNTLLQSRGPDLDLPHRRPGDTFSLGTAKQA